MHRKVIVVAVVGLLAALIVPAAIAGQRTIQRFAASGVRTLTLTGTTIDLCARLA